MTSMSQSEIDKIISKSEGSSSNDSVQFSWAIMLPVKDVIIIRNEIADLDCSSYKKSRVSTPITGHKCKRKFENTHWAGPKIQNLNLNQIYFSYCTLLCKFFFYFM